MQPKLCRASPSRDSSMTCPGRTYMQLVELVPIGQAAPPHTHSVVFIGHRSPPSHSMCNRYRLACLTHTWRGTEGGIGRHASHTHELALATRQATTRT